MMFSSNRAAIARPIIALVSGAVLLLATAVAQAAEPLTTQQRQELTQVLDKLTASRTAMADMITECSGGTIMIIACRPPRNPGQPPGCNEAVASCDLVAALHETDAAIANLQKTLGK